MRVAVLGPGGVGGLIAAALDRAAIDVTVIARDSTVLAIREQGLRVRSVRLGEFLARPRALASLEEPADALIVCTKAAGLQAALERICASPRVVLPLLNGLDHLSVLRERFCVPQTRVLAGAIRVESDRPQPATVIHTSPFLRIDMASADAAAQDDMRALARLLNDVDIPARVVESEPQVMWAKLVRLNALACTTSAYDKLLGEIRSTPRLRADLVGAIQEACAVAKAEGAEIKPADAVQELQEAHPTLGSSMQRDIAAGRTPELDAIAGAVLRAAARHSIACPTITRLAQTVAERAGVPPPAVH